MSEPDKVQWIDPNTSLDCLIHRGPSGALCGYVGVPPGHRLHGVDYNEAERADGEYFEVHCGLTFADSCGKSDEATGRGICHIPEEGRPHDLWWLGFDCAHAYDHCPAHARSYSVGNDIYRDLRYVKREVAALAAQLVE